MSTRTDMLSALQNGVRAINNLSNKFNNILPPAYYFNRISQVQGATIPAGITTIGTIGYNSQGDMGGGLYYRVASKPATQGSVQSKDGAWFQLVNEDYTSAKQFGATGDGTTDDSTALTNWINCGSQYLYLPEGTYILSSTLTIPNAVKHIIGPGTLKWNGANSFLGMIKFSNYTGDRCEIESIRFNCNSTSFSAVLCVYFTGTAQNITFRNCHFNQSGRFALYSDGTGLQTNCGMEDCLIENFAQSGIWTADGTYSNYQRWFFRGNRILGTGSQSHHCVNASGDYIQFTDNIVTNGVITKFGVGINGGKGTVVSRNIIVDCAGDQMDVLSRGGLQLREFLVSDNTGLQPNTVNVDGAGLSVVCDSDNSGNAVFDGVFANNLSQNVAGGAIGALNLSTAVNGTISNVLFVGNVAINPNQANSSGPPGTAPAFFASAAGGQAVTRCSFFDNFAYSADGKMRYGFSETGTGPNNNLVDSEFRGFATGPFITVGANTLVRKYAYTVGGLPTDHTNLQGERSLVTDATAPTFANVVAGSSSTIVPVYSDGTAWRVG